MPRPSPHPSPLLMPQRISHSQHPPQRARPAFPSRSARRAPGHEQGKGTHAHDRHRQRHPRHPRHPHRRRLGLCLLFAAQGREEARRHQPPAVQHEGAAREHAALRGRGDGDARGCPGDRRLAEGRALHPRDPVSPGARADAGFHRRALRRRSRGDARRHHQARRRRPEDQSAGARPPRHRSLGDGRRIRHAQGVRGQCRARIRPQPRALRIPQMGIEGARQFLGGAAGDGHLPPGQSRIYRPRGLVLGRRQGGDGRLSGHARRHRQPYDDGQRPGHPRLGRRRDRGRGGDARPAGQHADPRGGGLQAHRRAAGGHHRHRPGAHRHADAARQGRGGALRRILRPPALAA